MTDQTAAALPTLADMTPKERAACQWMLADVDQQGRAVVLLPSANGGRAILTDREGNVFYEDRADVTPRPDLPRMEWPGGDMTPKFHEEWRTIDAYDSGLVAHHYDNRDDARADVKRNPHRVAQRRRVSGWETDQ